jgi:hypothetical protein
MGNLTHVLDNLCFLDFFFFKMSTADTDSQGRLCKRIREKITAMKERINKRSIVIERAVLRSHVMVAPFDFNNWIFQENGWLNLFNSNNIYPRLVREFYMNMEIVHFQQHCPVLETKVRGTEIRIDPKLTSSVTGILLSPALGIPFPDSVDPPSKEDLMRCFDPRGAQVWEENQKFIPIGWLESP